MQRLIRFFNKTSEFIFGLASIIYMFLSYVEKDHVISHQHLTISLLAFIGLQVLILVHKQEDLDGQSNVVYLQAKS